MEIRPYNPNDLDQCVDLAKRFAEEFNVPILSGYDGSRFTELYENPGTETYIAEIDNKIVGVVSFIHMPDPWTNEIICQELHWFVDKEYRGSLGKKLLALMERRAREEDDAELRVSSRKPIPGFEALETTYRKKL